MSGLGLGGGSASSWLSSSSSFSRSPFAEQPFKPSSENHDFKLAQHGSKS